LPTVVLAKAGGEEIDRTLGYVATDEFISTIDGYHSGIGTLASMMAEEEKRSGDADFLLKMGEKLYAHSRFADADERYAGIIKIDSLNAAGLADDAQLKRAQVSGKLENYPLAVAFCEALTKRWPNSDLLPDATIYAAYYSDKAGLPDDAIRRYGQYLEKWPKGEDAEWAQKQVEKLKSPPSEN
jgi:outer membrane protein assembly factor BamD (BamD/ComL family)